MGCLYLTKKVQREPNQHKSQTTPTPHSAGATARSAPAISLSLSLSLHTLHTLHPPHPASHTVSPLRCAVDPSKERTTRTASVVLSIVVCCHYRLLRLPLLVTIRRDAQRGRERERERQREGGGGVTLCVRAGRQAGRQGGEEEGDREDGTKTTGELYRSRRNARRTEGAAAPGTERSGVTGRCTPAPRARTWVAAPRAQMGAAVFLSSTEQD